MIKQKTVLEVKIGERIYEMCMSPDSPLGEIYDALSQIRLFVVNKINEQNKLESPEKDVCCSEESCCPCDSTKE